MDIITNIIATGVVATAFTDSWALVRRRWLGLPVPNWGFVGRWIGHFPRGEFAHASIGRAAPIAGERLIGWLAHYAIGIGFASLLAVIAGVGWFESPTITPALLLGLGTVAAPLFIMQPAMGVRATVASRLHSLVTHAIFGVGLYAGACLVH